MDRPSSPETSSESNALSKRSASQGHSHLASAPADSFSVYILRCADNSFYVGHTQNLHDRVQTHNNGAGATWTACRRPVELVYSSPTHPQNMPSSANAS